MRSGELLQAIDKYKVEGIRGWAWIFGRVLVGYLNEGKWFRGYDLIIPSPTYVGEGVDFDHTGLVIERAAIEDGELAVLDARDHEDDGDDPVPRPHLAGAASDHERGSFARRSPSPTLRWSTGSESSSMTTCSRRDSPSGR